MGCQSLARTDASLCLPCYVSMSISWENQPRGELPKEPARCLGSIMSSEKCLLLSPTLSPWCLWGTDVSLPWGWGSQCCSLGSVQGRGNSPSSAWVPVPSSLAHSVEKAGCTWKGLSLHASCCQWSEIILGWGHLAAHSSSCATLHGMTMYFLGTLWRRENMDLKPYSKGTLKLLYKTLSRRCPTLPMTMPTCFMVLWKLWQNAGKHIFLVTLFFVPPLSNPL